MSSRADRRAGAGVVVRGGVVVPSVLAASASLTGNIVCDGELQIDGIVEGNVTARRLVVSKEGRVLGDVECEVVSVHGTIQGTITAHSVYLASSARLRGEVTYERVIIEPGAFVEGHVRHISALPSAAASVRRSEAV
ncbi:MAG: polymer-forming cytoskeletal protein [Alphaproteobacteria bacterium]